MKRCPRCGLERLANEYQKDRTRKDGLGFYCGPCARELRRTSYKKKPPGREKNRRDRLAIYGLTPDEYDAYFAAQDGACAICRLPETTGTKWGTLKSLAVDHDKVTGRVRGLLCHKCNLAIGFLDHDVGRLSEAMAYLSRYESTNTIFLSDDD